MTELIDRTRHPSDLTCELDIGMVEITLQRATQALIRRTASLPTFNSSEPVLQSSKIVKAFWKCICAITHAFFGTQGPGDFDMMNSSWYSVSSDKYCVSGVFQVPFDREKEIRHALIAWLVRRSVCESNEQFRGAGFRRYEPVAEGRRW